MAHYSTYIVLVLSIAFVQCEDQAQHVDPEYLTGSPLAVDTNEASTPLSDASLMVISESVDVSDNHTTVSIDQIQPNISVVTNASLIRKFSCFEEERGDSFNSTFQMINGSVFLSLLKQNPNITSRGQVANCSIILFYATWCPFSILAAPHLNALPRSFPSMNFYAIDAHLHNSLSTMQGVMAIPSLFLFHNGKAAARFNETEYRLDLFATFLTRYTGIKPLDNLNHTSADFLGPLPTVMVEVTDPWLILSWIVFFVSVIYWFTLSNFFWSFIENIRNTWREAEAQHEHAE